MKGLLLLLGLIGIANCIPTQYQDVHVYKCPKLPADAIGTCSEDCSGDESCGSETQKCCPNGCGHVCMEAKVTTVSLPYYELPRQCPSEYPGGVACGSECAEDSDCETGELCCSGQTCGQACLAVPLPTCADVLEEVKKSALLGTYVPQCNEEGTAFSREQFWEGGTWCVDELTGKPESLGPCEEVQDGDQSDDSDGRHDDSDSRHGHHDESHDHDEGDSDGSDSDSRHGHHDGSHDHHDDSDGSKDGSKSDGSKSDGSKSDGSKSDESEDRPDEHHGGDGDHHNNGGHHGNGDPHGDIIYDYFEDDDDGRRKWWHPVLVGSVGFMLLLIGVTIVLIIIMAVLIKKNKRFSHKPLTSSSSVNEDIDAVCYKDAIKMETLGKEYKPDAVA